MEKSVELWRVFIVCCSNLAIFGAGILAGKNIEPFWGITMLILAVAGSCIALWY